MRLHCFGIVLCILFNGRLNLAQLNTAATATFSAPVVKSLRWSHTNYLRTNDEAPPVKIFGGKTPADEDDSKDEEKKEIEDTTHTISDLPKVDNAANSDSSNNTTSGSSSSDDEIIKDLLNSNTTGISKPTVIQNGSNKAKKPIGIVKSPDDDSKSDDLKEVMDSTMVKPKSKNKVKVKGTSTVNTENEGNYHNSLKSIKSSRISSRRKRMIDISSWSSRPLYLLDSAVDTEAKAEDEAGTETETESVTSASDIQGTVATDNLDKSVNEAAQSREGGVISQGQVGTEDDSESKEESSSSGKHRSGRFNQQTESDSSRSETKTTAVEGGSMIGSGGGMELENGNRNTQGAVVESTQHNISHTTSASGVTGTSGVSGVFGTSGISGVSGVSGVSAGETIGSSSSSSSSSLATSSEPAFPPYPVMNKPGKCRPLSKGLACIALSPDLSKCNTDNACPGTKKCCRYGCAPYTRVGICEFPVV